MKWMMVSLSVEWTRLINPHKRFLSDDIMSSEPTNFFLDHKHSFGNRTWIGRRIAGLCLVFITNYETCINYGIYSYI